MLVRLAQISFCRPGSLELRIQMSQASGDLNYSHMPSQPPPIHQCLTALRLTLQDMVYRQRPGDSSSLVIRLPTYHVVTQNADVSALLLVSSEG